MTRESISEKVQEVICQQLRVDAEYVAQSRDMDLIGIGADSLDKVEIAMTLEEEYSVEIDDGIAESLKTAGMIEDWLVKALIK